MYRSVHDHDHTRPRRVNRTPASFPATNPHSPTYRTYKPKAFNTPPPVPTKPSALSGGSPPPPPVPTKPSALVGNTPPRRSSPPPLYLPPPADESRTAKRPEPPERPHPPAKPELPRKINVTLRRDIDFSFSDGDPNRKPKAKSSSLPSTPVATQKNTSPPRSPQKISPMCDIIDDLTNSEPAAKLHKRLRDLKLGVKHKSHSVKLFREKNRTSNRSLPWPISVKKSKPAAQIVHPEHLKQTQDFYENLVGVLKATDAPHGRSGSQHTVETRKKRASSMQTWDKMKRLGGNDDKNEISPGIQYESQREKLSDGLKHSVKVEHFLEKLMKLYENFGTELTDLAETYLEKLDETKSMEEPVCFGISKRFIEMVHDIATSYTQCADEVSNAANEMEEFRDQASQSHKTMVELEPKLTIQLRQCRSNLGKAREKGQIRVSELYRKRHDLEDAKDKERERVNSLHYGKGGSGKRSREKVNKLQNEAHLKLQKAYEAAINYSAQISRFQTDYKRYYKEDLPGLVKRMRRLDKERRESLCTSLKKCTNVQHNLHKKVLDATRSYLAIKQVSPKSDGGSGGRKRSVSIQPDISEIKYDLSLSPAGIKNMIRELTEERQPSLSDVIVVNQTLKGYFKTFLQESFCEENLEFYEDAVEYSGILNHDERRRKAQEIYQQYIGPESPKMINIVSANFQYIAENLERADKSLFYESQKEIYQLMVSDSLPKFVGSQNYMEYLIKINE